MAGILVATLIIVIVIYAYMRRKAKQRSAKSRAMNSVRDYHASYDRIRNRSQLRDKHTGFQPYVTKYNSSEDYRER